MRTFCATMLMASLCLAIASYVFAEGFSWDQKSFLDNVVGIARRTDLRDITALGKALGVEVTVHPYCGYGTCEGKTVLGMLHAFPDPPIHLPGQDGLWAEYYAPDHDDPPKSGLALIGTLAVLDVFVPRNRFCLKRADVRSALGTEAFIGSSLGRGEPLDVALNYVATENAEYRTVAEFVFAGRILDDGCLAYASMRQDNFSRKLGLVASNSAFKPLQRSSKEGPYFEESPVDLVSPRDIFDPAGQDLPVGMTLQDFSTRHPECEIGPAAAAEEFIPITDVPPSVIPLLPEVGGAYLATSHSIRETARHGSGKYPALDASLLTRHDVTCKVPDPRPETKILGKLAYQRYEILSFHNSIAVLSKGRAAVGTYRPAGIVLAEEAAQMAGTETTTAMLPVDYRTLPMPPFGTGRVRGVAYNRSKDAGFMVEAVTPLEMAADIFLQQSGVRYAFIDMRLWRAYSKRVSEKFRAQRRGSYDGLEEFCTATECPWPSATTSDGSPRPARKLLDVLRKLVGSGDLMDLGAIGRALATKAVIVGSDGFIRDRFGHVPTIPRPGAPGAPLTIGLKPASTVLDPLGFQYLLYPDGFPADNGQLALTQYHRKVAEFNIGVLNNSYCVTREDLADAFGSNDYKGRGFFETYAHKFDLTSSKGPQIYVSLTFGNDRFGDPNCAMSLSLSQYKLVTP